MGPSILPAMHDPEAARPRRRSPFAAAFLSLIFPGLGQLYAGAPMRALAFAAGPILILALGGGLILRVDRIELLGFMIDPAVLDAILVVNLAVLVYRLIAIVDAYRVAAYLNAASEPGAGRIGRVRLGRDPLAIAGLVAIVLVMAGSHVVVARYDMLAQGLLDDGCIFLADQSDECDLDTASPSPDASNTPEPVDSLEPTGTPEPDSTPVGSALPEVQIPPWDGKERLNILLVGADQRPGQGTFNTDTLIVVSIDPKTNQVTMFSLPRDTVDVPIPEGPARGVFGSVYSNKINAWWTNIRLRDDLFPGTRKTRGFNGLKAILGNLYGLDIKYFVEVNFDGFKKIVDVMGGVTVNVQVPVSDDRYPAAEGTLRRLYIPSGIRHMDGGEALRYARSRHGSNDFDRGARQQRILLSLREQADPQALIPRLPDLIQALKSAVSTDIPRDQLAPLLGLASKIDTKDIQSYVFSPPYYGTESLFSPRGYIIEPNISRIRGAVRDAFSADPPDEAQRQDLAEEGAGVWVLNGTTDSGRGTRLAGYLEYHGLAASAPRQKPPGGVPADTQIVVYNGAEDQLAETIAFLEKAFKVTATYVTDPAIRTDVIVTIGRNTKDLAAPPIS
jgi:LCP family protein required for cell wall assembly